MFKCTPDRDKNGCTHKLVTGLPLYTKYSVSDSDRYNEIVERYVSVDVYVFDNECAAPA